MEVGKGALRGIQPPDGMLKIGIQGGVVGLALECMAQKFGKEEGYGRLDGVEHQSHIIIIYPNVFRTRQFAIRTYGRLKLHHRQGCPQCGV